MIAIPLLPPRERTPVKNRYKVILRDRSIEIHQADRIVNAYGEVRLMDEDHEEVASWDEDEVHSIQEIEE